LEYPAGGSPTALAFITGRIDETTFSVQSPTGAAPTAANSGTVVNIFRAYNSLSAWEANTLGNQNANINAAVAGSVPYAAYDLTTNNNIYMVACYADAADTTAVTIDGWTTSATNYIKVYTPTSASEAGTSQRHTGKAGTGYRLAPDTDAPGTPYRILGINEEFVRVEGIELDGSDVDNANQFFGVEIL
jgi:hypothetical protein